MLVYTHTIINKKDPSQALNICVIQLVLSLECGLSGALVFVGVRKIDSAFGTSGL